MSPRAQSRGLKQPYMKQFNINNLVRENIQNCKPYSSARDEFTDFNTDMVFLDANENPFENGINRYPDPKQQFVKKLVATQKKVSTQHILLGNGSDEVLDLIFRAFCEPKKDNIIILPPTYGMYKVLAAINDIEIKEVLLTKAYQPKTITILKSSNENSKILFLCSPNNPTGNSFNTEEVEKLLIHFKGIVVIDEAYIDFSAQKSWLERLEEFPNLIITQTFSKAYGMAGIRLGICYASQEIITILNSIKPPYNVNQLTQLKAVERLGNITSIQNEIQKIKVQRIWLAKELRKIDFIHTIYPSDANFILIQVDDATKRYNQLIERKIVVRNRTEQPLCNNCLRITVGTLEENSKLIKELTNLTDF